MKSLLCMVLVYINTDQNLCQVSGIYYDKITVDEAMSFIDFTQHVKMYPDLASTQDEGKNLINIIGLKDPEFSGSIWQYRDDEYGSYYIANVGISSEEPFVFRGSNEN